MLSRKWNGHLLLKDLLLGHEPFSPSPPHSRSVAPNMAPIASECCWSAGCLENVHFTSWPVSRTRLQVSPALLVHSVVLHAHLVCYFDQYFPNMAMKPNPWVNWSKDIDCQDTFHILWMRLWGWESRICVVLNIPGGLRNWAMAGEPLISG